jgi:gamma-glutamyl-gamma-aminobutyrate hydrolase PuuD
MRGGRALIGITQRVDMANPHRERRDVLDQRWISFLGNCGYALAPIPNEPGAVLEWLERIRPQGIILSGGNDLANLGGDAPERDETEAATLEWAVRSHIPVLGICRGMQFLLHRSGAKLQKRTGHVAVRHEIDGTIGRDVNSFHSWCVTEVPAEWQVLGRCDDGSIEAVQHLSLPHAAIMWHPERESPFRQEDIHWIKSHFGSTG